MTQPPRALRSFRPGVIREILEARRDGAWTHSIKSIGKMFVGFEPMSFELFDETDLHLEPAPGTRTNRP
jgi:hypothetical protein